MIPVAILLLAAQVTSPPPLIAPDQPLPPIIQQAFDRVVTPPRPRYPVQSVISPIDYPSAAPRGFRGIVVMELFIDKIGQPTECRIQHSSGIWQVDSATCNLVRRRARFTPAADREGNPSIGRVTVQVDWGQAFKRFPGLR